MGKRNYLIYFLFVILIIYTGLFFCSQKAIAADDNLVINEIYPHPNSGEVEWIEIFNPGPALSSLKDYTIEDGTASPKDLSAYSLPANGYLLLSKGTDYNFGLNDSGDTIKLKFIDGTIDQVTYGDWNDGNMADNAPRPDIGESIARSPNGQDTDSDSSDFIVEINPTPGAENREVVPPPPPVEYPEELFDFINFDDALIYQVQVSSIIDGDTIKVSGLPGTFPSTVRLLYADTPEEGEPFYELSKSFTAQLLGQTIDLLISQKKSEQIDLYDRTLAVIISNESVFNIKLLEQGLASIYNETNAVIIKDAWLEVVQQAQEGRIGLWEHAAEIVFSELLPDPRGDDALGEWIELYNPSDSKVVLSRYLLDQYLIPAGTNICAGCFLVLPRSQTGVILSNSGDNIRLFFPGGLLLSEVTYEEAGEGLALALINKTWYWTTEPTPGGTNILAEETEETQDSEEDSDVPINSDPIEIKTGEFRSFENYLVTIYGAVISTSGNTFYLDDGSGQAKVYIQEATGIAKPPMHRGDVFEVTGIVNLYRNTWRILPQKQDDVKLIQKAVSNSSSSTVIKKASAKAKTTKSPTTAINARSPTKQVASTDDVKVAGLKSPWWVQLIKAVTGLAVVLLFLIIVQILRWRRENPKQNDFGDET